MDVYQYWKEKGSSKSFEATVYCDEPKTAGNSQKKILEMKTFPLLRIFSGLLCAIDNCQNSGVSPGYKTNYSEDKNHDIFGQHLFAYVRSEGDVLKDWRKDECL